MPGMSQEIIRGGSSHDAAEINFSIDFFDFLGDTGAKERSRFKDGHEGAIALPEGSRNLKDSLLSFTGKKSTQSIHEALTVWYDSVLSTSTTRELDLLDILAVVQHRRVNILPIQWNKDDEELGKGGTAGVAPGVNARVSDDNVSLDFAFKRVHREGPAGCDESSNFKTLFSEVLVLGHPVIRHHPNIVKLEGICFEDVNEKAWPVLVFQRAKHRDMKIFMSHEPRRKLDLKERLKLCGDIAHAILLMHTCCVMHGDLKPENVLIFEDERGNFTAKVCDFGYSTLRTNDEDQIILAESWPWTAPEILIENKTTFARAKSADIFSFGMLCIWILFVDSLETQAKAMEGLWKRETLPEHVLSELKKQGQLFDYANAETSRITGISEDRRATLNRFFESSLSENIDKRTLDAEVIKLVFGCTEETDVLMAQFGKSANSASEPFFQLTSAYRQFKAARPSLRESVFKCFETRAGDDTNDAARNNSAFQLAFCYNIGFGVLSDADKSTYWLSQCDKGAEDLNDVLKMINDDESRLYGDLKVHASMFKDRGGKSRNKGKGKRITGELDTAERSISLREGLDLSPMGPAIGWIFSNFGVKNAEIKFLDVSGDETDDNGRFELMKHCREEFGWDEDDSKYSSATIELALHEDDIATKGPAYGGNADVTPRSQEEEEKAQLERVETKIRVLGQSHPDTLESMETLGRLYWRNEERWAEAERLVIQVMEILLESLGVDHPDTLEAMQRAAMMHKCFERWEEEEDLLLRIMEVRMRLFGIRKKETLEWLEHLVRLFLHTERIADAEALQVQVIDARMIAPGITDLDGIKSMELMVEVLMADEAKFEEAERLQQLIVSARRHTVGDQEIETLKSIEVLVAMYIVHGQRYEEAERLQTQATDATERLLGAEHPDTLQSMQRLASIYALNQHYQQAEKMYRHIVEVSTRVFGATHKDGLQAMQFLALVYRMQQRFSDLKDVQQMIVESREQNFGSEDIATIEAKHDLASTYMRLQQWEDAQALYDNVVELRQQILGANNEETLKSTKDLAMVYKALGLYEKARDLLSYVLDRRREALGPQHPMTAKTMYDLAEIYKHLGSWKKAEKLLHGENSAGRDSEFTDTAGDTEDETFKTCRTLKDLNEVIPVLEEGVMIIPDEHPIRAVKLHELSEIFMHRFHRYTQDLDDLGKAIMWADQAVKATLEKSPARPSLLRILGKALWCRFENTGDQRDMNKAVEKAEEAVEIVEDINPDRAVILANLAKMLVRRFENTQDGEDLDAALIWAEQANMSLPDGHPDRAITLHRLSDTHWHQFNHSGNMDDLEEAIGYGEQALEVLDDDDCKRSLRLNLLAKMCKARFGLTGAIEHLEQALIWSEQAVESMPNTGEKAFSKGVWLGDLISLFGERFKLTEDLNDLNQSIRRAEEAANIASDESLGLPLGAILSNLAAQYFEQFTHTAEPECLEKAMQAADRSVEVTPEGHEYREHVLHTQQAIYEQLEDSFEIVEMVAAEETMEQNVDSGEQVG